MNWTLYFGIILVVLSVYGTMTELLKAAAIVRSKKGGTINYTFEIILLIVGIGFIMWGLS